MNFAALPAPLRRQAIWLRDALGYGQMVPSLLGTAELLRARSAAPTRRVRLLANAIRRLPNGARLAAVGRELADLADRDPAAVRAAAEAAYAERGIAPAVTRTTILKAPGPDGERGVLLSLFEYNWERILHGVGDRLPELLGEYDIIWEASWSNTTYLPLVAALARSDAPILVHPSNQGEAARLRLLGPRVRVAPTLPCEFLDPEGFAPRPVGERDVDLLVVSNWAPFKRHWEFFRALRHLPPALRVVCVGQPESGHTLEDVKDLARLFGVRQAIDFRDSIPPQEVRRLQERSRAAAVFSRREGHCIAAVEALFAGASLGLRRGAHVGPTAYLGAATGLALDPAHLGRDIGRLVDEAETRTPRAWALAHIGYPLATERLNTWLREESARRGLPWTSDIAPHWFGPYPWVGHPADRERLGPAAASLHARFPETFPADLLESSRR